ncbi:MAG: D-inositol-3-phosphate glycosyltransferase [Myxococcota bacterium]|nr:D-inositol-3-phosphate glycosyltransferase [Myxococcota bacterium]
MEIPGDLRRLRVALVHDWLTGYRGGERVLMEFALMFPDAPVFTLAHVKGSLPPQLEGRDIRTSLIQDLPGAAKHYRRYLPLFPFAIEQFRFGGFDLVLSSSHCVARGVIVPPGCVHVSYIHTPMRYVWDLFDQYFGASGDGGLARWGVSAAAHYLRMWEEGSVHRADRYIANSTEVAQRIQRRYGKAAAVAHPPVDTEFFAPDPSAKRGDHYLVVSALAPYKRVDLAIAAAKKTGRSLRVVGDGPELKKLRRMAGPGVEFTGRLTNEEVRAEMRSCRAFLFPGLEDFGIAPVEAMACGTPVIAYGAGGVLDSVDGVFSGEEWRREATGVFFREQTADSLANAIRYFEDHGPNDPALMRYRARRFSREAFWNRMMDELSAAMGATG